MLKWWRDMAKANGHNLAAMTAELKTAWADEPEGLDGKRLQLSALAAHYYWWV